MTWLASPFGIFVCGVVLGVVVAALSTRRALRVRKAGIILCALSVSQLGAFYWYPIADIVMRPLENWACSMAAEAPSHGYAAILVLGPIGRPPPPGSGLDNAPAGSATNRVFLAARLYHAGLAPRIIASGGVLERAYGTSLVPEAESIRLLLQDLGVPDHAIALETRSVNTRENARESRKLLEYQDKIALVTSAYHMPRAMREMRSAGLHAFAFPAGFFIPKHNRSAEQRWLPSPGAPRMAALAMKEWLAILAER